ncbi:Flavin-binding monooxygenase-like protein [Cooperia oncophora]
MHNTELYKYFISYADHFDLTKYIKFNHKVLNIERSQSYEKSGQWDVTYEDQSGSKKSDVFDAVLLCCGHHAIPRMPTPWPGQERFKGRIIHSHSYRSHVGYEDKVVVIVGVGNSGGDLAVELSRIAKQVIIRFRSAENGGNGYEDKVVVVVGVGNSGGDLAVELSRIAKQVTVRFRSAENSDNCVVIFATGFKFHFPMVEGGKLIPVHENEVDLYEYMYPPETADHNTLAVIGLIQPLGSIMPISEMQARLFYENLFGSHRIPSVAEMKKSIQKKRDAMKACFVQSPRHTIQVDYMEYMEELAGLMGCKPDVPRIFMSDPLFALQV